MTQERIDLTQFDGMYDTEGIGPNPKNLFEEVEEEFKDGGVKTKPLYLSNQEVNAITLLPELIAELKRCYETIDGFEETVDHLEVAEDVLGRSGWSDVYSQELEKRLYE